MGAPGPMHAEAGYSAIISPEPPNSAGKSFSLGSPSRMPSTLATGCLQFDRTAKAFSHMRHGSP